MKFNKIMNYDFPEINHIDDVIPHIEDWQEFKVMEKDWYTVVNYMVAFDETFSHVRHRSIHNMKIRRECRGLIFNTETGDLISRPYHKFFNVGEREETAINKVNLYEPHVVLEKLDGSMIRPIPTKEGFRLATKAGITDVAMNAEVFIADKPEYAKFIRSSIACGMTPIFEWVSRKNRIVVDYPEDNLILTAVRDNLSGTYLHHSVIVETGKNYNIPVVKAIAGDEIDLQKIVDHIRKWDDGEGIVLRFNSGHMVKVKADEYVLRHKSKEQINQEKNVLQTILSDSVDDLLPLLTPEDASRLKDFQNVFWASVDDLAYEMAQIYLGGNAVYPDKKDFAVEFVQKKILPIHAPIMYAMKGGKGSRDTIVDMINKSLTNQTKIDQNRWLWGGLNWNYNNIDTKN
jgi:RNA ligase